MGEKAAVYENDATTGIFVTMGSLVIVVGLVSMVGFYRKRYRQAIRVRSPFVVLVTDALCLSYVLYLILEFLATDQEGWDCRSGWWAPAVFNVLIGCLYVGRCFMLWFQFEVAIEISAEHTLRQRAKRQSLLVPSSSSATLGPSPSLRDLRMSIQINRTAVEAQNPVFFRAEDEISRKLQLEHLASDQGWVFMKRRHLVKPLYFSGMMACLVLTFLVPALIIHAVNPAPTDTSAIECAYPAGRVFITVSVVLLIMLFLGIAMRMREIVDGFFIKQELKIAASAAIFGVFVFAISSFAAPSFDEDYYPLRDTATMLVMATMVATSTTVPLWRSVSNPPSSVLLRAPENINTLEGLLHDNRGRAIFKEHLALEFSLENLIFWEMVEEYRAVCASGRLRSRDVRKLAHEIYERCVRSGAPYEVNLPFQVSDNIKWMLYSKLQSGSVRVDREAPDDDDASSSDGHLSEQALRERDLLPDEDDNEVSPGLPTVQLGVPLDELVRERVEATFRLSNASNLESVDDDDILSAIDNEDVDIDGALFDDAQDCIFRLLQSDSYRRFVLSEPYRNFISTILQEDLQDQLLTNLDNVA